ncbi:MAG: NAD(P)H-dependent oxidoreductase, partial [Eubacteriales bacterium]
MKLGLINASPRGKNSNSAHILNWLTRDINETIEKTLVYAVKAENQAQAIESIKACDYYVVIFPLYADSMPGIAKAFFEKMMLKKESFTGKPVLFIIHSGFPEAVQSRMAERYVRHFARLLNMQTMGCIIIGNSEGIRMHPKQASSKRAEAIAHIGRTIPEKRTLTEAESTLPGQLEKMPKPMITLFKILAPLMDSGWH